MSKKTLLIIGAKSDIGVAIANKYASKGYSIQLAGRNIEEINIISKDINIRHDVIIDNYELDILDIGSHLKFINNLKTIPEIVICVVGKMGNQNDNEYQLEKRLDVIKTNYEGPLNILSEFANLFEKDGSGTIVGVSSVAGERGRAKNYIYGSAKAGFIAFLSGLRNRLYKKNVHVVTVLPGPVFTKLTVGMKLPKLLTTNVNQVAEDIYLGINKKKDIIYTLRIWRLVMMIIKLIPEKIFKKMNI